MPTDLEHVKCPSVFFVGLIGIKLPLLTKPGIKLGNGLRLMRDRPATERMLNSYLDRLGSLEHGFLVNSTSAIIYANESVGIDQSCPAEWINGLLIQRLSEVQNFLMKLWLIKDNAVDPDAGWMNVTISPGPIINNNRWSSTYSKADGSSEPTEFSKEEISEAAALPLRAEDASIGKAVPLYRAGVSDDFLTKLSHGSLRVQRFLYFVNGARTSRDLAIKIAMYCSGLEAMVSSSHTELTHQVAERVAVLLYPRGQERLECYRQVKTAYGFRSKAVHGASFREKDHGKLVAASTKIDQVCREVTLAYLSSSDFESALESKDDAFSEFWMQKLFL